MVGGHVEGPEVLLDLHAGGIGRHDEAGDAGGVAVIAAGPGEDHAVGGHVHAGGPHLLAIDQPAGLAVLFMGNPAGLHVGGVRAVQGLGQAEDGAHLSLQEKVGVGLVLGVGSELLEHQDEGVVPDDRVLVLEVVVQAQALGGQVLADYGHGQVRAALAAHLRGPGEAQVSGLVSQLAGLTQEILPLMAGQAAAVPVGPRPFPAMVKEPDIVVLALERLDLTLDELVEFSKVSNEFGGQIEVHDVSLRSAGLAPRPLMLTNYKPILRRADRQVPYSPEAPLRHGSRYSRSPRRPGAETRRNRRRKGPAPYGRSQHGDLGLQPDWRR